MRAAIVKRSLLIAVSLAITAACLFGSAGRLDWSHAWVLLSLSFITGVAFTVVLLRNPDLEAERSNYKAGKSWDKTIVSLGVLLGPMAMWITAGLERRLYPSSGMPSWMLGAGVAVALLGGALATWAMGTNQFFSAVVRIQKDRGHTVIDSGPYRYIRHPGYAGMSAFTLVTPLILGSWWAFIPSVVTAGISVLRTIWEDRTLHNELDGYREYASRVKYKLVPGIW